MHFVCVFGPPAVGKMTVGHEIARLTGFKLFHNHMSVEPILEVFDFGSPPFGRLVTEIRQRVVEEAVGCGLSGLIFTYVWALDDAGDARQVSGLVEIVDRGGGTVHFVELTAPFDVRRGRNVTELRREHKRTHRDAELSDRILHDLERHTLNTPAHGDTPDEAAAVLDGRNHVRIDNTRLSAAEVAQQVVDRLALPVC
ncbi:MAG: AAA family ATPase [Nocardioides sp.]